MSLRLSLRWLAGLLSGPDRLLLHWLVTGHIGKKVRGPFFAFFVVGLATLTHALSEPLNFYLLIIKAQYAQRGKFALDFRHGRTSGFFPSLDTFDAVSLAARYQ